MTFPLLPTRNAATKLSIPDPLPKSTIVSPGLSAARMKIVVDAGERVDRLTRDPVDIPRPVAEALGQRAPHLEVIGAVRSFGDIAVHCLDLGFEFAGIKAAAIGTGILLWNGLRGSRIGSTSATVKARRSNPAVARVTGALIERKYSSVGRGYDAVGSVIDDETVGQRRCRDQRRAEAEDAGVPAQAVESPPQQGTSR
jgi:hypothetical protein